MTVEMGLGMFFYNMGALAIGCTIIYLILNNK